MTTLLTTIQKNRNIIISIVAKQPSYQEMELIEIENLLFYDLRKNGIMRLTTAGLTILKQLFPCWSQVLSDTGTFDDLIYMFKVTQKPFHLNIKKETILTTFDKDFGVMLKMINGDITRLKSLYPQKH